MGRTKAKKKVHPMPRLGFADQMIYALGYLLILAGLAAMFWFRFYWVEDRMMAQPGAVAYEPRGCINWYPVFMVSVMLSLAIPWSTLHNKRYPFFGKRGVKYGPPAYPRTFPLFMKNKPQYWKSPTESRMRKTTAIFVVALNLVLLMMVPLAIHGRNMLYEDGTFRQYTVFDRVKREYRPEDAESVTISIGRHKTGKFSYTWRLTVRIDYGDREYRFYSRSFSGADWVDTMAQVLGQFDPEIIQVWNIEKLDDYGRGLSEENYRKLAELYEFYEK